MVEESGHRLSRLLAVFLCASMLTGALVLAPQTAKTSPDSAAFQGVVLDGSNPVSGAYAQAMLIMANGPPTANAGPDQTVNAGGIVTFDGTGSSDDLDSLAQLNLTWTFTYDSGLMTLWDSSPSFQFNTPGTYVATLTVTDTGGLGGTDTVTINVNVPPVANAGPDSLVNSGAVVTLNGSGTMDDFDTLATLNFTWNFTYDGSPVEIYGVVQTFTFVIGGMYDIRLTVRDSGGLTHIDYVAVTVNTAPEAIAGPDQTVNIGDTVTFDGSLTGDDLDTLATLNFAWSFTYSGIARNLWGVLPSFQFGEIGSYIVTLTVTDTNGLSSTDAMLVDVNGPPTANAGPDQTSRVGDTVSLDGSMSNDDAGASALNYTWNGTAVGWSAMLFTAHPTYVFQAAGTYTLTLTVRDAGGLTGNDTVTITVGPANAAPVAVAGSDQTVKSGDLVLFDGGQSTDDAGVVGLNYTWEFVYEGVAEKVYGPQPTFTFEESGTYAVTLTVKDAENLTSTDVVTVTVEKASKSFVSQYWWSLLIIAVAAVALVALLLMKRKGSGGSVGEEEELEEETPKKVVPPPDEEEL